MLTVAGFLLIACGGSVIRLVATSRWPGGHLGTMSVNVLGSFALGLLASTGGTAMTIVGTGGLGALTTFSTFAAEAVGMADTPMGRRNGRVVGHTLNMVVLCVGAAALGLFLGD